MVKALSDNRTNVHQFLVAGRHVPTDANKNTKIYKMRIFANDEVRAKSKFWYFLSKLNKIKRANGEILSCSEVIKFLKFI